MFQAKNLWISRWEAEEGARGDFKGGDLTIGRGEPGVSSVRRCGFALVFGNRNAEI